MSKLELRGSFNVGTDRSMLCSAVQIFFSFFFLSFFLFLVRFALFLVPSFTVRVFSFAVFVNLSFFFFL